jgi:C-terminal processing protease CtpA/Prc
MFNYLNPPRAEREQIIAAAVDVFKQRFYEPSLSGFDIDASLEGQRTALLETPDFPSAMKSFFELCKARPIDFFYFPERTVPLGRLLKTTFFEAESGEVFFRDVLIGGRAEEAGILSGFRLTGINGGDPRKEQLRVSAVKPFDISIQGIDGRAKTLKFDAPATWRPRKEKNLAFKDLGNGLGYVRIASWPGILGMDVARETDAAIKSMRAKKLIVDLRGNTGSAGAGNVRIMSYLTPERIPVGYSLTRRRAQDGYDRNDLPRLERIPRFKFAVPFVLWKFRKVDKSIVVVTEGLKKQAFHGNVMMLVNQHTISGAEIVTHFAKELGLARIVGERTAGLSLAHATLPLPFDYRLTLPIGDYVPWHGERFEDVGVQPEVCVPYAVDQHPAADSQLEETIRLAR